MGRAEPKQAAMRWPHAHNHARRKVTERNVKRNRRLFAGLGIDVSPLSDVEVLVAAMATNELAYYKKTDAGSFLKLHLDLIQEHGLRRFFGWVQKTALEQRASMTATQEPHEQVPSQVEP